MRWLLLTVLFVGCSGKDDDLEPVEVVWMEGAGYGWKLFNHRLSHLELRVDESGGRAAIIGGTSTTGVVTEYDEGCDPSTCDEFPFYDEADIQLHWARAEAEVAFGVGTAELVVGSEGGTVDLEVPIEGDGASTVAVIRGIVISSDEPVEGEPGCYQPANGWMPRRIQVSVGEPVASEGSVTVPVSAAFAAGNTLEDARQCVDEVASRARARFAVDVLVVTGEGVTESHEISQERVFAFSGDKFEPEAQEPPAPEPLSAPDEALVAWSAVDYTFHTDDPDLRGAYLRTLAFHAGPGEASASATNYSPGTQLSGFDYAFTGTVRVLPLGVAVTRGTISDRIPAEVDAEGEAVLHTYAF